MAEPLQSNSYDPWDYSGYTHAHQENPMFHPTESNGSQQCRPTYTKRQLTQIYDRMAARDQLVVPFDCDIPVTLHREGVMVGYQEFAEDKWVCMGYDGNVMGPMRKAEVLKGKNVESVVPLSWLRRQSVSLAQFAKIWEELEESQKENRRQVIKGGGGGEEEGVPCGWAFFYCWKTAWHNFEAWGKLHNVLGLMVSSKGMCLCQKGG